MTKVLDDKDFNLLKGSLPHGFREHLKNEEAILAKAYPLLDRICKDRELMERLKTGLKIPVPPSGPELMQQLLAKFQALTNQFQVDVLFPYRLPIVLSEFPLHSRAINKAIAGFNEVLEDHHRKYDQPLPNERLSEHYHAILKSVQEHGSFCDGESLWQFFGLIAGWSKTSLDPTVKTLNVAIEIVANPVGPSLVQPTSLQAESEPSPVTIHELRETHDPSMQNPFVPDYNYNINGAGRLASETNYLLLNAFGMKIGGHFDAQAKYPPRFIPLEQLHAMMRRQLSHRMEVNPGISFQLWLESTLHQLGTGFIQKTEGEFSKDILVNPFFKEPISFLSPEKISITLKQTLAQFNSDELKPSEAELEILSQYVFELLQAFQINPGQALGIGANWDGTINLSNEAGAQAFKFTPSQEEWGRRFKQLSLHRQGPSEAKMNAALGIQFEIQTLLSDFEYMSQLQPTEYPEVLYNALIDNLVTDLFPEPAYFENTTYQKYRKHYVVTRRENNTLAFEEFLQPSNQGTYFKDKEGHEKQTPMYRRAGTLDVQAFPRNTTYCEQSRVSYEGNPLGPLQLQYAQAMHRTTRGHVVYDPIAADQFIEDSFYGQVLRSDNGDYLPFIGVIPKNFDKHFHQDSELCASFVIRMLQSAHMMEHCHTFKDAYGQLITRFLPPRESQAPALPKFCSEYIAKKLEQLRAALAHKDRSFTKSQNLFYGVFKNLVYSLYELGRTDEHFRHSFLPFINTRETFYPISRAKCDKLIRDFTVNRPVYVSPELLARYDEVLTFLRDLNAYFYPKPSDEFAKIIAKQARIQIKPLLQSQSIQTYFNSLKQNKQTNFSRKQSPGMLYSALKDNGPSRTVVQDYGRMHHHHFPSYYRDPDGTPNGEPQTNEQLMDLGAKTLGALLQIMHKYQPWALIYKPISEPILRGREQSARHQFDSTKPLWVSKGVLEGFFWNGVAMGTWQSASAPFKMLVDFISWQDHAMKQKPSTTESNPLAFSAAPANEPNIKVLASAHSRDYLLELLGHRNSILQKKEELIDYTMALTKYLYPYFSEYDLNLLKPKLVSVFPLDEASWDTLFHSSFHLGPVDICSIAPATPTFCGLSEESMDPADNPRDVGLETKCQQTLVQHEQLLALLKHYNPCINRSLIQAVFQCVTSPLFTLNPESIIKKTQSAFSLNAKQNEALKKIMELYQETPDEQKQHVIDLFRYHGIIHKALQTRDQLLQKIQNVILKLFDKQWILEILFDAQIERITAELTLLNLQRILGRLPDSLKWPLKQLLVSNDARSLNEYSLTEQHHHFFSKAHSLFKQIQDLSTKEQCLNACRVETQKIESTLSIKDKAHLKWSRFAERELKHQLLSSAEGNDLFATLLNKVNKDAFLVHLINQLKKCYQNLVIQSDASVNAFFEAAHGIDVKLTQQMKDSKNAEIYFDGASILKNLIDVTMNVVINARLDQAEGGIFSKDISVNPLLSSKGISNWLIELQVNNRNLRSLLEQQIQQSQSIEHAIWRCKSILQVLEQAKPAERITKTGMQSLLRFWSQHRDNVTLTGERYINPKTGEANKANYSSLFKDSVTMEGAMKKVHEKQLGRSVTYNTK